MDYRPTTVVEKLADIDTSASKCPMFVIYDHPADFPDKFVVRYFDVKEPTEFALLVDTIEEARAAIPEGFICTPRMERDEPQIVEVWW